MAGNNAHFQDYDEIVIAEERETEAVMALMRRIAEVATPHFTAGWGDGNCGWLFEKFQQILAEAGLYKEEEPDPPRRKSLRLSVRRKVMERDKYRCLKCGTHKDLQVDHIVPVTKGGADDIDNLQTLCRKCNYEKMTSIVDYRKEVCDE